MEIQLETSMVNKHFLYLEITGKSMFIIDFRENMIMGLLDENADEQTLAQVSQQNKIRKPLQKRGTDNKVKKILLCLLHQEARHRYS